jgi:hypothetical protein
MTDYLEKEFDLKKVLKGSPVQEQLDRAAKAKLVRKDAFEATVSFLQKRCDELGIRTVRDLQGAPAMVGQLPLSGHGGDIFVIVALVSDHYKEEALQPIVEAPPAEEQPKQPRKAGK